MELAHVKRSYKQPRLVAGIGGWHIMSADGAACGKITRCKGSDKRVVVLRGTKAQLREIWESGILTSAEL